MLSRYIEAAMAHAAFKRLPESGLFFAEIPDLQGVWASADTLDAARAELQEVLEDWIELGLSMHHDIPVIDGIDINIQRPADVAH
jgi:predicted RNase H-like HicB family nuclease